MVAKACLKKHVQPKRDDDPMAEPAGGLARESTALRGDEMLLHSAQHDHVQCLDLDMEVPCNV